MYEYLACKINYQLIHYCGNKTAILYQLTIVNICHKIL